MYGNTLGGLETPARDVASLANRAVSTALADAADSGGTDT
jgi:hypothetical protein